MQHRIRLSSLALAAGLAATGMAWAGSDDKSAARDEEDCEIVHSQGGSGSGLSSSVTAGAGSVTGSTTTGGTTTTGGNGQSVTVRSGNGTSSSTVTGGASSSSGTSVVAGSGSGDCVVTIGPDGKTEKREKSR